MKKSAVCRYFATSVAVALLAGLFLPFTAKADSDAALDATVDAAPALAAGPACHSRADCVPASCCHPTSCVHRFRRPKCGDTDCTLECRPGTLDCGQGRCECEVGRCVARIFSSR